jgi:hypothetical protein
MPLPPDHIFVKIHDKLDAGYADLLAKLADYEARHHEFQLMHASLSPQERRDFLTDLNAYHRLIETFQRNLFLLSDRFEALLHQVWGYVRNTCKNQSQRRTGVCLGSDALHDTTHN